MYNIKKKKDDTGYEVRLSLGINSLTGKRMQKYMTAKTKTELTSKIQTYLLAVQNGTLDKGFNSISFSDLIKLDLQHRLELLESNFRSISTYREDERKMDKDILPFFKNASIQKLTKNEILSFREHLQKKSKLSNKTINKKMLVVKQLLDFAVEHGYLDTTPYQFIKPLPELQKEKDIWTSDEFSIFLSHVQKKENIIYLAFFTLAFTTGARLSELLTFKWEHIQSGIWEINSAFVYDRKLRTYILKQRPKTKSGIRTIVLDDDTLQLLKQVDTTYHDTYIFALNGVMPNGKHFTNKFISIIKSANLRPISFHGLRHSNVSYLLSLGIAPSLIAQRVGHSSSSFTERVYGHIILDAQKEIAQTLHANLNLNSK